MQSGRSMIPLSVCFVNVIEEVLYHCTNLTVGMPILKWHSISTCCSNKRYIYLNYFYKDFLCIEQCKNEQEIGRKDRGNTCSKWPETGNLTQDNQAPPSESHLSTPVTFDSSLFSMLIGFKYVALLQYHLALSCKHKNGAPWKQHLFGGIIAHKSI